MCPSLFLPAKTAVEPSVGAMLASCHDRSMAECDRALGPVTDSDATWIQRWGAMRYISEQLPELCRLEQELVDQLDPFLRPEVKSRVQTEGKQVCRLRQEVERLAYSRYTARSLARAVLELMQSLRIWYAEIEFATGAIPPLEISAEASRALDRLEERVP